MAFVKNLYKKSILFEIVNRKDPSIPIEAFTLTIPPETMDIEEEQRISRTKTFGGLFIDDYGPDNPKITIAGNTGGSDVRSTYVPSSLAASVPEKLNGREAFFYFRDRIMRYKNRKKFLSNYADFDLIIYDLSTVPENLSTSTEFTPKSEAEAYIVSLEKFKMTRNKEKPFFYNYSIELIVMRTLGTASGIFRSPVSKSNPRNLIQDLRRVIGTIQAKFTTVRSIKDQIEDAINLIDQLAEQIESFFQQAIDIITYPTSLSVLLFSKVKGVVNTINDLGEDWAETKGMVKEDYYRLISMATESLAASAALVTFGKTPSAAGRGIIKYYTQPLLAESPTKRLEGLTEEEAEIPENLMVRSIVEQEIVYIYGHISIKVDTTTSLEKLALEYYGDASLQELIAVYNKLEDTTDLEIGSTLKIPVLIQGSISFNNFIYSENLVDIYGKDILLDNLGNPVIGEFGDYLTVEGIENIIQALNLRLNQSLGSRLRLTVYGISASVGGASNKFAPISYILVNIKETVMQDPRVSDILNISLRGDGDKLYISFDAHTIKVGDTVPFRGGI